MSAKIRILQVVHAFATGGAEIYLYHLCRLLNRDLFEVYIVSFLKGDQLERKFSELNDIHIIQFEYSSRYDIRILPSLISVIHKIKPDIIHTQLPIANIYTRFACMFNKQLLISTQHSTEYIHNFYHAIDRLTAKRNDLYIANSDYTAKYLTEHHYSKPQNIQTISLSIQAPEFVPNLTDQELKSLNIPKDAKVIGMIGSFKAQKGHVYLINALKEVVAVNPNCVLLLIGEGLLVNTIKEQVTLLGLNENVRFLGLKSDIYPYLKLMQICVLPSLTESFGLVILDAMSQKIPVIAFNVDAIPELIGNGKTGILVPKADTKRLASAIIELLQDEEKRQFLAENAYQQHLQSFTFTQMVQSTEQLYLKLMEKH
jgi:glycosyltransferase involved in cell wall biosynthesis